MNDKAGLAPGFFVVSRKNPFLALQVPQK